MHDMTETLSSELCRFYEQANALAPTEAELARVVQQVPRYHRRGHALRRPAAMIVAVTVVLLGSAFAYPAARDALNGFFAGGEAPGVQADAGDLPAWLHGSVGLPSAHPAPGGARLLASQDGERLLAYRDANSGRACLVFGNDSDTCSDSSEWRRLFGSHALLKLASGVGPTRDGKVAVFGLARSSVVRVEIVDGSTIVADAAVTNGGWVVVADQGMHDRLLGLDAAGRTVESLDAHDWTWTFCFRESGCP
jgi:hypothetical protein